MGRNAGIYDAPGNGRVVARKGSAGTDFYVETLLLKNMLTNREYWSGISFL